MLVDEMPRACLATEIEARPFLSVSPPFEGATANVARTGEAGEPIVTLSGCSQTLANSSGYSAIVGFGVGEAAEYRFKGLMYATDAAEIESHIEWSYDPFGRKMYRTAYDSSGAMVAQTRYIYDGWRVVQEYDTIGETVLAEYVYGPGYLDDVVRVKRGEDIYYIHGDQQYSTTLATDSSGDPVEYYTYDAFGAPSFYDENGDSIPSTAISNDILYTGRAWDADLAQYDYRTRYYDPALGRFTSPDSIGAYGDWNNLGNPYSYVANNPGGAMDPFGFAEYDPIEDIFAGADIAMPGFRDAYPWAAFAASSDLANTVLEIGQTALIAPAAGLLPGIAGEMAAAGLNPTSEIQQQARVLTRFARDQGVGAILAPAILGEVKMVGSAAIQRARGLFFSEGTAATNKVFVDGMGRLVDSAGNPLTGTVKGGGATRYIVEGVPSTVLEESAASSRRLAANMTRAGMLKAPGEVTHHIVLGGSSNWRMVRSREILARFGISVDDAVNGVFLPDVPHRHIHTIPYMDALYKALGEAQSGEEAIGILRNVGQALRKGQWP